MLFDFEEDVEVAGRASGGARVAFVGQAQAGTVVHAGRDIDFQLPPHLAMALAAALGTRVTDNPAGADAGIAGTADGEKALLVEDLAAAVAGGAGGGAAAGFGTGGVAALARLGAGHLNFGGEAEHSFFEGDLEIVADVFAALGAGAAPAAASEQIAETEEIAQNIAEIGEGVGVELRATGGALQAGVAKAVVGRPLLRIAQHAVGFRGLLEALLGVRIIGIPVGMELQG